MKILLTNSSNDNVISTVVDGTTGKTYTGINGGISKAPEIHPDLKNALPAKSLEIGMMLQIVQNAMPLTWHCGIRLN